MHANMNFRTFKVLSLVALGLLSSIASACEVPVPVDSSNVVPVIWNRSAAEANFQKGQRVIPHQHINDELTVAFVENRKKLLVYFFVPLEEAECWQKHSALTQHLKNLVSEVPTFRSFEFADGVLMVVAGGNFESSLILARRILAEAAESQGDTLAVGIPARDLLFIADPSNPVAIAALRKRVAKAYRESERTISGKVFLLDRCQISVFPEEVAASTTSGKGCGQ